MNRLTYVVALATVALLSVSPGNAQEAVPAAPTAGAPLTTVAEVPPVVAVPAVAVPAVAAVPHAVAAVPPPVATNAAIRVVDAAASNEPVVSMVFDETPITDVIKAFRDATGANIISGGTNLQGLVSVRLDNVPWRKGLSSILEPQGLQLIEQPAGSGIYLVSMKSDVIPKVTRTFDLAHAKSDEVAKLFAVTLGKNGTATAFASANVVIITAPEQQVNECEAILKAIDKPRPQVYIEARFVEMSASASKKLGMKWDTLGLQDGWGVGTKGVSAGWQRTDAELNTFKPGTTTVRPGAVRLADGTYANETVQDVLVPDKILSADVANRSANDMMWSSVHTVGGQLTVDDFRIAMNAFEEEGGVSIFSNPKIIVGNEEIAKIDMTTKEPNVEVDFQAATQLGQRDSVSTKLAIIPGKTEPFVGEAFFSYGITLAVTPRISPSGMITVDIMPAISELQSYYKPSGLDENQPVARYPIIKMQRMQTVFTMASGTTAVIGGLTKTIENSSDSGIPGLRKIPWIGPRLFGWKGREKEQREIIIFVTVGLADPITMEQDIGLPKNAVLSREVINGTVKEPGDRTKEDLLSLKDPVRPKSSKQPAVTPMKEAEAIRQEAAEKQPVEMPAAEAQPAADSATPAAVEKPQAGTPAPLLTDK